MCLHILLLPPTYTRITHRIKCSSRLHIDAQHTLFICSMFMLENAEVVLSLIQNLVRTKENSSNDTCSLCWAPSKCEHEINSILRFLLSRLILSEYVAPQNLLFSLHLFVSIIWLPICFVNVSMYHVESHGMGKAGKVTLCTHELHCVSKTS